MTPVSPPGVGPWPDCSNLTDVPSLTPFVPVRWLAHPHLQTIAAARRRRRFAWGWTEETVDSLILPDGSSVEVHWVDAGEGTPVLILLHGMTGSARSGTVLGISHKAWRAGWSSLRVNLYDSSVRSRPPRVFHAGASEVVPAAVDWVRRWRGDAPTALAGVSMGANILLKALGEWGERAPRLVFGAAVISPLLDLSTSWARLEEPANRVYQWYYVGRLKSLILEHRHRLGAALDLESVERVRTILEFDATVTAPLGGYRDVFHYYEAAASRPWLASIRVPTLLIHSRDDPFLDWTPLAGRDVVASPWLVPWLTHAGGHAAFLEARPSGWDRSWAENRVVEWLKSMRPGPGVAESQAAR